MVLAWGIYRVFPVWIWYDLQTTAVFLSEYLVSNYGQGGWID
jgi:hypothetical protein